MHEAYILWIMLDIVRHNVYRLGLGFENVNIIVLVLQVSTRT